MITFGTLESLIRPRVGKQRSTNSWKIYSPPRTLAAGSYSTTGCRKFWPRTFPSYVLQAPTSWWEQRTRSLISNLRPWILTLFGTLKSCSSVERKHLANHDHSPRKSSEQANESVFRFSPGSRVPKGEG